MTSDKQFLKEARNASRDNMSNTAIKNRDTRSSKKRIIFFVRVTENVGGRRRILPQEFKDRRSAKKLVTKILSKPKFKIVNGKKVFRTSFREAQSGTGLNNPRVVKMTVFR